MRVGLNAAIPLLACALVVASADAADHPASKRSQAVLRAFQHEQPCPSTGKTSGRCPGFVKDHVVPLCNGGPDAVGNLQWQSVADAKAKDKVERAQCRRARNGRYAHQRETFQTQPLLQP